jgi:DNA polymerase III delta prime subunit
MSETTSTLFTEQLRPQTLDQAILVPRVRTQLQNELNSKEGLISNILFYGGPGQGKTTLSRIMAKGHDPKIINCSEVGIDAVREDIQRYASQLSLDGNGGEKIKVVLLEECDGFSNEAWKAMRATVEKYANSVRFVANCNYIEKVPEPIKSRFTCIQLEPINQEEKEYLFNGYCKRISDLLKALKISYTEEDLKKFVEIYFPDFRSILNNVQRLVLSGAKELTADTIANSFDFDKLFDLILNGNSPWENYKTVTSEYADNASDCIIQIGNKFPEYLRNKAPNLEPKLPAIILAIAEHMDMLTRSINQKITLLSLIYKIQIILKQ